MTAHVPEVMLVTGGAGFIGNHCIARRGGSDLAPFHGVFAEKA